MIGAADRLQCLGYLFSDLRVTCAAGSSDERRNVMTSKLYRRVSRAVVLLGAMALTLSAAGAAWAAVPITTISTDPYTHTSSHHQTEVEPDTYSFGSTIVSAF